jgi:hypothetical protein
MTKQTKKAQRELRKRVERELWRAPKSHGAKVMAGWLRAERKRRREREQNIADIGFMPFPVAR